MVRRLKAHEGRARVCGRCEAQGRQSRSAPPANRPACCAGYFSASDQEAFALLLAAPRSGSRGGVSEGGQTHHVALIVVTLLCHPHGLKLEGKVVAKGAVEPEHGLVAVVEEVADSAYD